VSRQIIYQTPEVLLLRTVINRKNDKIGCDEKNNKEKFYSEKLSKCLKFSFQNVKGEE
jgi:hypothetical protein